MDNPPHMNHTALAGAIETAANRVLALDPEVRAQLAALAGRTIEMHLQGLELHLYLQPHDGGLQVLSRHEGEADVCLQGTPLAFARMGLRKSSADSLLEGEIRIHGDTRLGTRFSRLLQRLEIDWEELLAGMVGDVAARPLGNLARQFLAWQARARESLLLDTGEYLQEESRQLPAAGEAEAWLDAVDELRDDVERLQARLTLIETRLKAEDDAT